jgi:hypothetical protein
MKIKYPLAILLLSTFSPVVVFSQWMTNASGDIHTVSTTADVGIGINNPTAKFHIANGGFRHGGTGEINIDAPNIIGGRFKITDNGFIGIGNATPQFKLDIATIGAVGLNISGNTSSYTGPDLQLTRSSSYPFVGQAPTIQFNSSPNRSNIIQGSDEGLQFFTAEPSGWKERMRITTEGNIGIGTINPWFAKLQIESATASGYALRLEAGNFSMNGNARFEVDAPGVFGGRLLVNTDGNVGIGTTTPTDKLTVNGKIKAEEIQVVVDVPADYVFDSTYKLMPLSEVSQYIERHKHLPNVPSAKDLINNGWNVGEMNNKLLEKVEELTLYLIELKKENDDLKKENEKIALLEVRIKAIENKLK